MENCSETYLNLVDNFESRERLNFLRRQQIYSDKKLRKLRKKKKKEPLTLEEQREEAFLAWFITQ